MHAALFPLSVALKAIMLYIFGSLVVAEALAEFEGNISTQPNRLRYLLPIDGLTKQHKMGCKICGEEWGQSADGADKAGANVMPSM